MNGRKGVRQSFRVQSRTARGSIGIGLPFETNRPVGQRGQAFHSGRTPRSQSGQTSGWAVTSTKELRFVPHQGQKLIDSAIGPSQAQQSKRVSKILPKRFRNQWVSAAKGSETLRVGCGGRG